MGKSPSPALMEERQEPRIFGTRAADARAAPVVRRAGEAGGSERGWGLEEGGD